MITCNPLLEAALDSIPCNPLRPAILVLYTYTYTHTVHNYDTKPHVYICKRCDIYTLVLRYSKYIMIVNRQRYHSSHFIDYIVIVLTPFTVLDCFMGDWEAIICS